MVRLQYTQLRTCTCTLYVCMHVRTRQGLFTSVAPQYTGHLIENKKMNYDLLM